MVTDPTGDVYLGISMVIVGAILAAVTFVISFRIRH